MAKTFSWTTQCILGLLCLTVCVHMLQLQGRAKHVQQHVRSGKPIAQLFHMFKQEHVKLYSTEAEERIRSEIFHSNVNHITQHNEKYEKGQSTYYLGINQFSDLTHDEFLAKHLTGNLIWPKGSPARMGPHYVPDTDVSSAFPDAVDWKEKGYVTKVKNQGDCGACWAFSATGSLEGQYFRKTGKLISLSDQQLVDCCSNSNRYGNRGCRGGHMNTAFRYARRNGGVEHESDYPYSANDGPFCDERQIRPKVKVRGLLNIKSGNEHNLHHAVGKLGPISVAIDAHISDFHSYEGGVLTQTGCNNSWLGLNHATLVAGYGTLHGTDFWLIKNSWGPKWGDHGYIRLLRNSDNYCGIATAPSFPIV